MMAIAGGALLALDRAVGRKRTRQGLVAPALFQVSRLLPQGRRQHKRNFRKLATPAVR
jgi:hypothetical protein